MKYNELSELAKENAMQNVEDYLNIGLDSLIAREANEYKKKLENIGFNNVNVEEIYNISCGETKFTDAIYKEMEIDSVLIGIESINLMSPEDYTKKYLSFSYKNQHEIEVNDSNNNLNKLKESEDFSEIYDAYINQIKNQISNYFWSESFDLEEELDKEYEKYYLDIADRAQEEINDFDFDENGKIT